MSRYGDVVRLVRDERTRAVLSAALEGGWEYVGYTKAGHIEIRWPATEQVLHCGTTPSDRNSWKTFAKDIERVSGVVAWRPGNRRRSRKPVRRGVAPEVAASRRRHQAELARREAAGAAAEEQRRRRQLAADRSGDDDRRRREIESLMRPGFGR